MRTVHSLTGGWSNSQIKTGAITPSARPFALFSLSTVSFHFRKNSKSLYCIRQCSFYSRPIIIHTLKPYLHSIQPWCASQLTSAASCLMHSNGRTALRYIYYESKLDGQSGSSLLINCTLIRGQKIDSGTSSAHEKL